MLSLLDTRTSHFAGLRASGAWALRFPPPEGIKFNAVVEGRCLLTVGEQAPVELHCGDCFLLTQPLPFHLASEVGLPSIDAVPFFRAAEAGIARIGEPCADELLLIGGRFDFGAEATLLFDGLPSVVIVRSDSTGASVLRWSLQLLAQELSGPAPGTTLMARQLGQMMLVQVLRTHIAAQRDDTRGWLFALSDRRINSAIAAMHADPARRWSVHELAALAGASRSSFALRFKQKVGLSPLEYLLRWRMLLAARALARQELTVSAIGQSLGYDSDSAFSNAFKRVTAQSPRDYRSTVLARPG